jgi:hypothetical protein
VKSGAVFIDSGQKEFANDFRLEREETAPCTYTIIRPPSRRT